MATDQARPLGRQLDHELAPTPSRAGRTRDVSRSLGEKSTISEVRRGPHWGLEGSLLDRAQAPIGRQQSHRRRPDQRGGEAQRAGTCPMCTFRNIF